MFDNNNNNLDKKCQDYPLFDDAKNSIYKIIKKNITTTRSLL